MKKQSLIILLVLFGNIHLFAQQSKNQVSISLGAASSLAGTVISLSGNENSSNSPALNVNTDLGMNDKFSLGLSYCYQNFKIPIYYYVSSMNRTDVSTIERQNFGVRFIFHFTSKKDLDFYSGLRLGYMTHTVKNPISYASYYDNNLVGGRKNRYTQQVFFGGKYYWNETFGVFGEIAIGFPFAFNVGLGMRIN